MPKLDLVASSLKDAPLLKKTLGLAINKLWRYAGVSGVALYELPDLSKEDESVIGNLIKSSNEISGVFVRFQGTAAVSP